MIISAVFLGMRRRGPRLVILGVMTVLAAGAAFWYWSSPPLNVILVTFDTTRADRLGAYGYERGLTKGFDDFARRGVVFDRAYAPAPITLPSHATMLTGLYPPEHGLRINGAGRLGKDVPFLPEILKERGYDTGAFIAAAVLDSKYGLDRGFDTYEDDLSKEMAKDHSGEPRRDAQDVIDSAISWLRQRTSRPFFCWIHLYDAHAPYDSRPEIFGQKFVESPYDAGVAREVQQFERLTAFLTENKLDVKTLVVVAGDHGEGLDDHLESEHGMLVYNTTLLVPFAFVGPPQCRPGTRVSESVSLVDFTPTVLDLLGISAPARVSGRSLVEALKGKPIGDRDCYAEANTPFAYNHWSPLQTLISGRWKYIHTTRPELFDLADDPGERTNLIESAPEKRQELQAALDIMRAEFVPAAVQNLRLSDKDVAQLRALGYAGGGKAPNAIGDAENTEALPDVKDMLPLVNKFDQARHMSMGGNLEGAIALLQEVVASTNEFPAAGVLLGECQAEAGRLDDAVTTFRSVLEKRPDFSGARSTLGKILAQQGHREQAVAEFREAIRQNPDSATTHFEMAQALVSLGQAEEAIAEYRLAIELAPDFTAANVQLGQLLAGVGKTGEAAACFAEALSYDPNVAIAHQYLMILLAQTGQPDKAIQHGLKAVALEPNSFEARFNLGLLLVAQRRYRDGIAELREAGKLRPDDPRPAIQIRQAESALGRAGTFSDKRAND